jgi:hypothetical protein
VREREASCLAFPSFVRGLGLGLVRDEVQVGGGGCWIPPGFPCVALVLLL